MSESTLIYQTLEDLDNYDKCEEEGPYPCRWKNTWLGNGYYFWYHHISLAHWWGNSRYGEDNYVIFESVCEDLSKCWDLHSDGNHQEEFMNWLMVLEDKRLLKPSTTVAQVVEFIKNECSTFKYEAIRILGIDSLSKTSAQNFNMPRVHFEVPKNNEKGNKQKFKAYYDVIPPVQFCLFKKDSLKRKGFDVIYPEEYRADYAAVF